MVLGLSKNILLSLSLGALVTLVLFAIAEKSNMRSPSYLYEIPPLLSQYSLYPGFKDSPRKCLQSIRWTNFSASCDFLSRDADADVLKFYQQELHLHGWLQQNKNAYRWRSPSENSVVIGVFRKAELFFFLERPDTENVADNKITYRLRVTTYERIKN